MGVNECIGASIDGQDASSVLMCDDKGVYFNYYAGCTDCSCEMQQYAHYYDDEEESEEEGDACHEMVCHTSSKRKRVHLRKNVIAWIRRTCHCFLRMVSLHNMKCKIHKVENWRYHWHLLVRLWLLWLWLVWHDVFVRVAEIKNMFLSNELFYFYHLFALVLAHFNDLAA